MEKYRLDCRFFNGYKPCSPGKVCTGCGDYSPMGTRILIINLDALGDVLRTTAMLYPLKRRYPQSHVTWLTLKTAAPLLENNNYIDTVLEYSGANALLLMTERFDVLMNADKSKMSGSLANLIDAKEKFGFGVAETGAIYPFNQEAEELYEAGLNDELKFRINKKSEQELLCGAMGLEYKRDGYILNLTSEEKSFVENQKKEMGMKDNQVVIGFNTGCSDLYPYKRLAPDKQALLVKKLSQALPHERILLLGGKEDAENNSILKKKFPQKVIHTPTGEGLRRGILYLDICDIVLTGDTLALHIAIALGKNIVAWFTLTCENEIDLYDRGCKILADIDCRPCWKKECPKEPKCNEMVDIDKICEAAKELCSKVKKP